jgi:hypothetical protein
MKARRAIAALAALLMPIGDASARVPPPTTEEIATLVSHGGLRSYPQEPLATWEQDLRRALPGMSLRRAADTLAARYGISSTNMRTLVRLWVTAQARGYNSDRNSAAGTELRRQLLAFLRSAPRTALVVQGVAEALGLVDECSASDFEALMAGSRDRAADAWMIATAAPCNDNWLRAATAAPGREMPALIRLADWGTLDAADELPLHAWLTSPSALARIAPADRPAFSARLYRRYAQLLFETGLTQRAIDLIDGLPDDMRRRVMASAEGPSTAIVDALPMMMTQTHPDAFIGIELAAAYALAGRTADAEALFGTAIDLDVARRAFACVSGEETGPGPAACFRVPLAHQIVFQIDALLLDHLLHHPQDDPYPFAEAVFANDHAGSPGAPIAELRCRLFAEPQYANICGSARGAVLDRIHSDAYRPGAAESARAAAALEALPLPGYADARRTFAAELARLHAAAPQPREAEERRPRATVTPAPSPYMELPLPGAYRSRRSRPPPWPEDAAALPEGFIPVRFERSGERAVAISVSQTFDPTGEVSQGGYWVHLSGDGGRRWDPPLYTGLADRFPYVVRPDSRMPLLNGERIDLEVEVAEIDTASISYPPVALRTRRQASGLYLRIPLADLARDSDGDGIADIAEKTLLLDRARTDGGTPFVVGSDPRGDCAPPAPERLALLGLLQQLFGVESGAIVEPVDRPSEAPGIGEGWRGAAGAADRPIFIRGDPGDYLCLRPDRLMIVYSDRDIAELERFRPDFHPVEVPPIVYNRARDRGYVRWSAGWTGGTYRLRLVDGRWIFESAGNWAT